MKPFGNVIKFRALLWKEVLQLLHHINWLVKRTTFLILHDGNEKKYQIRCKKSILKLSKDFFLFKNKKSTRWLTKFRK
jgi:hypothetical protein